MKAFGVAQVRAWRDPGSLTLMLHKSTNPDVCGAGIEGSTNQEMADTQHISENTAKLHLRNIMQKLHLQNRGSG